MPAAQPDLQLNQALKNNSWLHFTQMKNVIDDPKPIVISRGEGSKVWDTAGKQYIDGLAGLFCVNVGYGRQEIIDAISEQLKKIAYVSPFAFPNEPAVELSAKLAAISPIGADSRVFFCYGWRRSRRVRPKNRQTISKVARLSGTLQDHFAAHRLSRHHDGRAVRRWLNRHS